MILQATWEHPFSYAMAGLVALSSTSEPAIVAVPTSTVGAIGLFDLTSKKALHTIQAHNGAVAALEISPDGSLLASASEKVQPTKTKFEQIRTNSGMTGHADSSLLDEDLHM